MPSFNCLLSAKHSCKKLLKSSDIFSSYTYNVGDSFYETQWLQVQMLACLHLKKPTISLFNTADVFSFLILNQFLLEL